MIKPNKNAAIWLDAKSFWTESQSEAERNSEKEREMPKHTESGRLSKTKLSLIQLFAQNIHKLNLIMFHSLKLLGLSRFVAKSVLIIEVECVRSIALVLFAEQSRQRDAVVCVFSLNFHACPAKKECPCAYFMLAFVPRCYFYHSHAPNHPLSLPIPPHSIIKLRYNIPTNIYAN